MGICGLKFWSVIQLRTLPMLAIDLFIDQYLIQLEHVKNHSEKDLFKFGMDYQDLLAVY